MKKWLWIIGLVCYCVKSQCQVTLQQLLNAKPNEISIVNETQINTPELEFSPIPYQDKIVFIANGNRQSQKSQNDKHYYNVYVASINANEMLEGFTPFSSSVNSKFNEGPLCFNATGDRLYLTRNNYVEGDKYEGKYQLSIYEATKGQEDWEGFENILAGNKKHSFVHPALSKDGKRLYFSSNISGGYGGYDLYYIEMSGDAWNPHLHNLGPEVNSPMNELFPTIIDQYVVFSSNRSNGAGGLDLYITQPSADRYMPAQLLPYPINSPSDDIGLQKMNDLFYFSSARPGGAGGDDIYHINYVPDLKTSTNLIFINAKTKERIGKLPIKLKTESGETIVESKSDINGEYKFIGQQNANYYIEVEDPEWKSYSKVIQLSENHIRLELFPKKVKYSFRFVDASDGSVIHGAEVKFENDCEQPEKLSADSTGLFGIKVPEKCNGKILMHREGYVDYIGMVDNLTHQGGLIYIQVNKQPISIIKGPVQVGGTFLLENIYYEFEQSTIKPGSESELNELVTVLKQYPTMMVDLVGHTDSRGDANGNLKLSLERAFTVKNYLVEKGINAERISITGRGETQPRNRCKDGVNCTEDEHQFNRRTEVRVMKL